VQIRQYPRLECVDQATYPVVLQPKKSVMSATGGKLDLWSREGIIPVQWADSQNRRNHQAQIHLLLPARGDDHQPLDLGGEMK